MSSRSSRVIVLLACGTSLAGLSATPAAQRQPAPVFRAGVQLLLVDVVVRDQEDEVYMPRGGSTVTAVATIRSVADEVRHRVALDLESADRKPSGRASTDACRAAADEAARWAGRDDGFVTPYGRGAWISVWADRPFDWEDLNQRIVRAYRLVAGKRMLRALDAQA